MIILIGVALLVPLPIAVYSPDLAASSFGVPVSGDEAQAYLLATATRDVALGVWLLSMLLLGAERRLLAVALWSIAIVAAGDAGNVGTYTQWKSFQTLAPHIAGFLVLLTAGCWLWATASPPQKSTKNTKE